MFFEKFETAGTKAGDVKEPAAADELHYDKRWDGEKNVGKFKHWRSDTHSIHRNSNSVRRLPSPPPPCFAPARHAHALARSTVSSACACVHMHARMNARAFACEI